MSPTRSLLLKFLVLAAAGILRAESNEALAVSSRTSDDYVRTRRADGSLLPEPYAFGRGGLWTGATGGDAIGRLDFTTIAGTIAGPLAAQNYVPAKDPATTRLLIMVYWGVTRAPEHAAGLPGYQLMQSATEQMSMARAHGDKGEMLEADSLMSSAASAVAVENQRRSRINLQNAQILGYESWWRSTAVLSGTVYGHLRLQDLLDELEEDRYFVVLMAYDFQLLWKHNQKKLLWETRFSMRERGNDFGGQLAAMTRGASRYFGRSSDGLTHQAFPEGRVEVGTARTLEYVPQK